MKRKLLALFILILSLCLCFALASCGENKQDNNASPQSSNNQPNVDSSATNSSSNDSVIGGGTSNDSSTDNTQSSENTGNSGTVDSGDTDNSNDGENVKPDTPHTHAYGEWTTTQEPTCTETGIKEKKCSCGDTVTETVNTTEHKYSNGYCTICKGKAPSEGLEYTLSADGTHYEVSDIGTCTDTDVIIPSTYKGLPVASINSFAFSDCTSLTSITIPGSITNIGYNAFEDCKNLTSVSYLGDIEDWCNINFVHKYANPLCNAGKLYIKGELVTELVIPDIVTDIEEYAFYGCTSLTSIIIPDSITSIGKGAFDNCTNLKYNEYDNGYYLGKEENPYVVLVKAKDESITNCEINENTKIIYYEAFENCRSLVSVTIPNGVTSIGEYAFHLCRSITSITIPNSVMSIGDNAFDYCDSLTSITISNSITNIGNDAFKKCTSLKYNEYDNGYYLGNEENPYLIFVKAKSESITNCEINKNTKIIYHEAFDDCQSLASITIPDGVTSIGDNAFDFCDSLTNITIGNGVISIGEYAFDGCTSLTSITIGNSVTSIGDYAFQYCDSLESIIIPDSVTNIGERAFFDCSNLVSITMPDNVTSIGREVFSGCGSLTSITIPNSVTRIGEGAFYNCTNLTSVNYLGSIEDWCNITYGNISANPLSCAKKLYIKGELVTDLVIPDTVTEIKQYAFSNCKIFTSVTIPDSVTSIGRYAFYGCTSLTSVAIGNGVTSIGDRAFQYCDGLESIIIPDSVTRIGEGAFYNCTNLTSVNYLGRIEDWCNINFEDEYANPLCNAGKLYIKGELVTDLVILDTVTIIKDYAFYKYTSLTSITIGNSVTSIGCMAFYDCTNLTGMTVGNSVTNIGDEAFRNCTSLTGMTIGNSVTSIGDEAFRNCTSLVSITIPDSVTNIGEGAFKSCKNLISATIGNNVTNISDEAFYECKSLTSVTIGNSVTNIGDRTFYDCTKLTSITIPESITRIGDYAFVYCYNLKYSEYDNGYYLGNEENPYVVLVETKDNYIKNIEINENTKIINEFAFSNCDGLTNITIPDGVIRISGEAFKGCDSLTDIIIPNSVTSIGHAFDGCTSLTSVNYLGEIEEWCNINFDGTYANPICFANNLYIKGELVTELVIPNTVTEIQSYAFEYYTRLTSVTIPDSVTSIGDSAFKGCTSLTSITIPDSVTSMGEYAFDYCTSLTIYCEAESQPVGWNGPWRYTYCPVVWNCNNNDIADDGFIYVVIDGIRYALKNWNATVSRQPSNIIEAIIPASITYNGINYSVRNIDYFAFENCKGFTSVTIPDSITRIEHSTFEGCTSLTSMNYLGEIESWYRINFGDEYANPLYYAKNLYIKGELVTELVIPETVTEIKSYAFCGCTSLTSVNYLGDIEDWCNITYGNISANPLSCAKKLYIKGELVTELVIPNTVTKIENYAFSGCDNLTSVKIENGVTSIGDSAFKGCTSLTNITIPDSVTKIGDYAFDYCRSLTSITIPDSVTKIGDYAFDDCDYLTIYCEVESKPSGWDSRWNYSNCPVVWGYTEE